MRFFRKHTPVEPVRRPHMTEVKDAYMFRRSRTLTGSLSNSVRAVGELSADLQSDRLKHHTLRAKRRKLGLVLLGCVVGAVTAIYLLDQYISHVSTVTEVIPVSRRASYEATVQAYLSNHPSEHFRFSLDQRKLLAFMQARHPEIADVEIAGGGFFQSSYFTPTLREPVAAWTLGQKTLYIDSSGTSFETLYTAPPSLVVEDKSGIDPNDTGVIASARMLRYIGRLVAFVQESGSQVEKVQLPPNTSRQVDLYLQGRPYAFKTNSDRDPAGQAADVIQAARHLDRVGLTPKYVDVRVSSKAYYQ